MSESKESETPLESVVAYDDSTQNSQEDGENLPNEKSPTSDENSSPVINSNLNPQEDEVDSETMKKIKGDAIGDTLYSERFVLKTLMQLKEQNGKNIEEAFEKDLELLWDMTIEKDVVKMLLEYSVLELFTSIIDLTEDERLIEILLGIIGNCCCLIDTREYLCGSPETMAIILSQLSSSDPLILHQLMRLLYSAILFENSGDESIWFNHFRNCNDLIEKFAFILSNSTSSTLIVSTFEALNAICAKFAIIEISESPKDTSFSQVFVKQILIDGLIESFRQIIPPVGFTDSEQNMTDLIPTQNVQKFMNLFLELNLILSQYESVSVEAYRANLDEFKKCLARILLPLTQKEHLLPLTTNHQGVIENINDIFQALGDMFDGKCFAEMVVIWKVIEDERKSKEKKNSSEWDDEDDEATVIDIDDVSMTILEFLTRTGFNCTQDEFVESVKLLSPEIVKHLFERIKTDSEEDEDEIKSVSEKLKLSLKTIWNVADNDVKS
jgi:hypothetical protein